MNNHATAAVQNGATPMPVQSTPSPTSTSSSTTTTTTTKSEAICRFWPKGVCKHGDDCRFQHLTPNVSNGVHASVVRSHSNNHPPPTSSSPPAPTVVSSGNTSNSSPSIGLPSSSTPSGKREYGWTKPGAGNSTSTRSNNPKVPPTAAPLPRVIPDSANAPKINLLPKVKGQTHSGTGNNTGLLAYPAPTALKPAALGGNSDELAGKIHSMSIGSAPSVIPSPTVQSRQSSQSNQASPSPSHAASTPSATTTASPSSTVSSIHTTRNSASSSPHQHHIRTMGAARPLMDKNLSGQGQSHNVSSGGHSRNSSIPLLPSPSPTISRTSTPTINTAPSSGVNQQQAPLLSTPTHSHHVRHLSGHNINGRQQTPPQQTSQAQFTQGANTNAAVPLQQQQQQQQPPSQAQAFLPTNTHSIQPNPFLFSPPALPQSVPPQTQSRVMNGRTLPMNGAPTNSLPGVPMLPPSVASHPVGNGLAAGSNGVLPTGSSLSHSPLNSFTPQQLQVMQNQLQAAAAAAAIAANGGGQSNFNAHSMTGQFPPNNFNAILPNGSAFYQSTPSHNPPQHHHHPHHHTHQRTGSNHHFHSNSTDRDRRQEVCKFWASGNCRYQNDPDQCPFAHWNVTNGAASTTKASNNVLPCDDSPPTASTDSMPSSSVSSPPSSFGPSTASSTPINASTTPVEPLAPFGGWLVADRVHRWRNLIILEKANATMPEIVQAKQAAKMNGLTGNEHELRPTQPRPASQYLSTLNIFNLDVCANKSFESYFSHSISPGQDHPVIRLLRDIVHLLEHDHKVEDYHLSVVESKRVITMEDRTTKGEAAYSTEAFDIGSLPGSFSSLVSSSDTAIVQATRTFLNDHANWHVRLLFGGVGTPLPHRERCMSCDEKESSALIEQLMYNNVWLDAQGRPMVVVTPHSHHERITALTDDQFHALYYDAYSFFREAKKHHHTAATNVPFAYEQLIINQGIFRNFAHLHLKAKIPPVTWSVLTSHNNNPTPSPVPMPVNEIIPFIHFKYADQMKIVEKIKNDPSHKKHPARSAQHQARLSIDLTNPSSTTVSVVSTSAVSHPSSHAGSMVTTNAVAGHIPVGAPAVPAVAPMGAPTFPPMIPPVSAPLPAQPPNWIYPPTQSLAAAAAGAAAAHLNGFNPLPYLSGYPPEMLLSLWQQVQLQQLQQQQQHRLMHQFLAHQHDQLQRQYLAQQSQLQPPSQMAPPVTPFVDPAILSSSAASSSVPGVVAAPSSVAPLLPLPAPLPLTEPSTVAPPTTNAPSESGPTPIVPVMPTAPGSLPTSAPNPQQLEQLLINPAFLQHINRGQGLPMAGGQFPMPFAAGSGGVGVGVGLGANGLPIQFDGIAPTFPSHMQHPLFLNQMASLQHPQQFPPPTQPANLPPHLLQQMYANVGGYPNSNNLRKGSKKVRNHPQSRMNNTNMPNPLMQPLNGLQSHQQQQSFIQPQQQQQQQPHPSSSAPAVHDPSSTAAGATNGFFQQ